MKTILYTSTARKALMALQPQVRERIRAKLVRYAESGVGDVTKLQGVEGARMRVGDYRIVLVETEDTIEVRAVGHRREIYR
ncbi:MAG: type II toxin-antitoxin system RelE/ParE family toxin [Pseudomonadota bacterium]